MEEDSIDSPPSNHGNKLQRRDSGLDLASIARVESVSRRESGLEISDLEKFRKTKLCEISGEIRNVSVSSVESLEERDGGSPIFHKPGKKKYFNIEKVDIMENQLEVGILHNDDMCVEDLEGSGLDSPMEEKDKTLGMENSLPENSLSENVIGKNNEPLTKETKNVGETLDETFKNIGENISLDAITNEENSQSENLDFDQMVENAVETLQKDTERNDFKKRLSPKDGKLAEKENIATKASSTKRRSLPNCILVQRPHLKDDKEKTTLLSKPPRPESSRPHSVSKFSVSSRVEVMLNSDVFKKYISRHENLIQRLAQKQGRGTNLKKALSNLDLSQIDFDGDLSKGETTNLNSSLSFNDEKDKNGFESLKSFRSRRSTLSEIDFRKNDDNLQDEVTENNVCRSSLDGGLGKFHKNNRQKFSIPSFQEFKKSRHFNQIPEENLEEYESSCENCDKNRLENERRKSRSHSRCQRIKEKYLQNHEELSSGSPVESFLVLRRQGNSMNSPDKTEGQSTVRENQSNIKVKRPSEIPVRIQSTSSPVCRTRQSKTLPVVDNTAEQGRPLRSRMLPKVPDKLSEKSESNRVEKSENKKSDQSEKSHSDRIDKTEKVKSDTTETGLPPKPSIDPNKQRTILRASRKRKMGQKKHFARSQSDSQLKVDSAKQDLKTKLKPAPLDLRNVQSCENFASNSSPLFSASTFDSGSNPSSATIGSFDFSNDHVIKFRLAEEGGVCPQANSPLSMETNLESINDSCNETMNYTDTPSALILPSDLEGNVSKSPRDKKISETGRTLLQNNISGLLDNLTPMVSGQDNSSAMINVELWSESSYKPVDNLEASSTSENSNMKQDFFVWPQTRLDMLSTTESGSEKVELYLSQQNECDGGLDEGDMKSSVTRSTSDVCCSTTSDALRKRRERKERPYKSDPFTGSPNLPAAKPRPFSLSKDEVFEVDEISLGDVEEESLISDQDWEKEKLVRHRLSDISTDSGVTAPEYPPSPTGTLFSTSSSIFCGDFPEPFTESVQKERGSGIRDNPKSPRSPLSRVLPGCKECGSYDNNNRTKICPKCEKKSIERKEIILEIKDTEESYGRDLAILKEHFYKPMKSAGLLSLENLEGIFLNIDELIHVNTQFVKKLQTAVDMATKKGDENLRTVSIGNLFLDSSSLILAFENYCVNQGQSVILLEQLEREKELLRIFLQVSQDENPILRRMPLKSFLMVPVQRIMRYPLLLERLYKFTSGDHSDKSSLMEAKIKIEDILDHINSKTKHGGTIKIKRKMQENIYQRISITEKIEVNKVAIEVLGWNRKEVCDISMCRLQVAALSEQTWAAKRLKSMKFTTVHCVLLTLGQGDNDISEIETDGLLFAKKSKIIQAAVVLIKEKNGRYQTFREPFMLNRCVVSVDPEVDLTFELSDLSKEPYLFKGDDQKELQTFLQTVKQQTLNLATWRRRRNALPNIMIKHMV